MLDQQYEYNYLKDVCCFVVSLWPKTSKRNNQL